MNIIHIILAIIFPPLPVALKYGVTKVFWINLILTLIFYIPGLIHAFVVLAKK
ncbi:YqaE/Pmp3 family membrane protein [Candidatus Campbellbacteria bacterium]|nr:YqaE/Pmp3 family membrane protein [Candidatus Campbellbacteria bacterium]|tara:strand:- start:1952 stop:2110 length:159 start_codon:yes stop_codon:yes gene_type:complete